MYFETVQAAFAMDGHGAYVWSAYGLTAAVLVLLLVVPVRRNSAARHRIRADLRRDQAKHKRNESSPGV